MNSSEPKIDLKSLISTRNFLAEIIQNAGNDYERAGAIQAFEVCYELTKHTVRKVLLLRAQEVYATPKEIFRLAGLEGLIPDAETWFEFAKKRNKTSHAYDGEVAKEILLSLPNFLRQLDLLLAKLKELPECYNSNQDITK
ncbi:MAG: nucleotidyltransferase substrate binding protein [Mollicutes bacterium UO1]